MWFIIAIDYLVLFVCTVCSTYRPSVACIFQGRGVAASATSLGTSRLKADAHRSLSRSSSNSSSGTLHFPGSTSGIKKSSICLQTKFRVVSRMHLDCPLGEGGGGGGGGGSFVAVVVVLLSEALAIFQLSNVITSVSVQLATIYM